MKKQIFLCIAVFTVCTPSYANLVMKIIADKTDLTIGETTIVRVYGLAEEAVAGNGLYDWGVSAVVDASGIIQANSAVILEPTPLDGNNSGYSLNIGSTGNIDASGVIAGSATESNAGVGYSELFNFEIQAVGSGAVQYSLSTIIGDLFDFSVAYDSRSGTGIFNAQDSVAAITVLPEPSSLLILSGLSLLGLGRKRK